MYRSFPATLATWCALIAAGASLLPVVDGAEWFFIAGFAGTVMLAVGYVLGSWLPHSLVIVVTQLAVLTVATFWLAADSISGILHPLATLREANPVLRQALTAIREDQPPLHSSPGLTLMLAVLVMLCALCLDILVHEMNSPLSGGTALLALHLAPMVALRGAAPLWSLIILGLSFIFLLATVYEQRSDGASPFYDRVTHRAPFVAACATVALGAMLAANAALPQPVDDRLRRAGGGGKISVVNPMYDIRKNLNERSTEELLRYTTEDPTPAPIRLAVVDSYDGVSFSPSPSTVKPSDQVQQGLPGADEVVERYGEAIQTDVQIQSFASESFLPVPDQPTRVDIEGDWLYDSDTLNVIGRDVSADSGLNYSVSSVQVAPAIGDLVDSIADVALGPEQWLQLPEELPSVISATAQDVVGDTTDDYGQVLLLQDYFRRDGGFTYSTQAPGEASSADLSAFLETKEGYCVHFASTMALMARSLDIPARVVVGFLPGAQEPDGSWVVRGIDAHAWPEVYFRGVGWVRFEPTPSNVGPLPPWTTPDVDLEEAPAEPEETPAETETDDSAGISDSERNRLEEAEQQDPQSESPETTDVPALSHRMLQAIRVLFLLAAVLAAVILVPRWFFARRQRRLYQGGGHLGPAAQTWRRLVAQLSDLGLTVRSSQTVSEACDQLRQELSHDEKVAAAIAELEDAVMAERYGVGGSSGTLSSTSQKLIDPIIAAQAAKVSRAQRLRAWWLPGA